MGKFTKMKSLKAPLTVSKAALRVRRNLLPLVVGSVVLVTFPFSDLKGQKVRPALVLANVEFDNLILCQITSKPYTSKLSICIKSEDFSEGNLPVISYVRPDKLFTADTTIIKDTIGKLTPKIRSKILQSVRGLFA